MCGLGVLEHSLHHSKHQQLHSIVAGDDDDNNDVDESVHAIAAVKKVDITLSPA